MRYDDGGDVENYDLGDMMKYAISGPVAAAAQIYIVGGLLAHSRCAGVSLSSVQRAAWVGLIIVVISIHLSRAYGPIPRPD